MSVIFDTLSKLINLINMGCQNYDDQFEELTNQITQLQSELEAQYEKELEDIEENLNQVEYAYFNEIITNIDENISGDLKTKEVRNQIDELNNVIDMFRKFEYESTMVLPFTNLQHAKNEVTIDSDVINLQNNIFYLFNLQQLEQASILIEKSNPQDPIDTTDSVDTNDNLSLLKIYGNITEITDFLHKKILLWVIIRLNYIVLMM